MTTLSPATPQVTVARPLAARWLDLLRDGNDGDYATDHGACMAVAIAMVRAGHTAADFIAEMSEPSNHLSEHYRFKDARRGRRYRQRRGTAAAAVKMRRDWNKAVTYAHTDAQIHTRAEALQYLGLIQAVIFTTLWCGRAGRRNITVLRILLSLGNERGTTTPAASVRALAELAHCSIATVSRAIAELVAAGWLTVMRSTTDPTLPTVYRLHVPSFHDSDSAGVQICNTSLPLTRGVTGVSVLDTATLDGAALAVHRMHPHLVAVCGSAAAVVEAALGEGCARSAAEVARRAGVSRQTAYTWLRRLASMGLAVLRAGVGWLRTSKLVDEEVGEEAQARARERAEGHSVHRAAWHYRLLHMPWTVFGGRAPRARGPRRAPGRVEESRR